MVAGMISPTQQSTQFTVCKVRVPYEFPTIEFPEELL